MNKKFYWALSLTLVALSSPVSAAPASSNDIQSILSNLQAIVVPMVNLILLFSGLAGIVFIFKALIHMKKFGQTGQHQPGEVSGPMVELLVGTVLLYLPTTTNLSLATLFGSGSMAGFTSISNNVFSSSTLNFAAGGTGQDLLQYSDNTGLSGAFSSLANTLVLYIQFIGFLSFVRGWFIIAKADGRSGGQPGTLGKGVIHIIGGLIAVNFVAAITIIQQTLYGT